MPGRRKNLALAMLVAGVLVTTPALAQKKYDPGATDTDAPNRSRRGLTVDRQCRQ